jgi:hypothetical protein
MIVTHAKKMKMVDVTIHIVKDKIANIVNMDTVKHHTAKIVIMDIAKPALQKKKKNKNGER